MDILWIIILFVLGLEIGSFLNVVIDRLPEDKSLVKPPSHCDNCGTRLKAIDLIPLISYLWLRGRCRYCGTQLTQRIFWVELATGLSLSLLWIKYDWSNDFWILAVYACLMIVIFVIDLNTQLILNKITYPACVFALATVPLRDEVTYIEWRDHALIGGLVGFTVLFLVVVISRGGMGFGDVKMAALMGFALGFPIIFVGLMIGILSGGTLAAIILLVRRKRGQVIPFGPFLAIGAMTALIWGNTIWDWYKDLYIQ